MPPEHPLFAYIHPTILPLSQAFLHVSDLSIQRGYGIFDYFRVYQGQPLFLPDYLDRFYQSAQLMDLPVVLSRPQLTDIIHELLRRNPLPVSGMKMILTGGYSPSGYAPAEPNLIITQHALTLPDPVYIQKGIKIITHEYLRELPVVKTINYSMGIRLLKQIKEQGAEEVLYHQGGIVSEFPRCNFFVVLTDGTVVTPSENILKGITRKTVLALAGKRYRTEVRTLRLDEIATAKEAFLTSTTRRIVPIVQVDDTQIGQGQPGEVTLSLLNDLIALEEESLINRSLS
jgi:branched-chain amino acid aminotransferase